MVAQVDAAQDQAENAAVFRSKFATLHRAAVGVVLIRTREPFRAIDTLKEFAHAEDNLDFKVWSIVWGWATHEKNSTAEPEVDGTNNPQVALAMIGGGVEGNNSGGFGNGIYCFLYPHMLNLNKNPTMIHCIKEYSKLFVEGKRRLVLILPVGYEVPQELEDDVVILDFDPPSRSELRHSYEWLLSGIDESRRPQYSEEEMDRILSAGAGMVASEFSMAVSRALMEYRSDLPNITIDNMVGVIMEVKTETVRKSEVLSLMQSENMDSVGGLDNLKEWLDKRRRCFGQDARDFGIDPPRGIALIGPPGTGKSLMAKATSHMLGLPLVRFDVGKVFQSLVGQSEGRVRAALKTVDAMAPCVMFIDEVDKCFQTNSSNGDSGVGQRVLGSILTWMQESKAPVFIVVTANRVESLPSEFLRRGRLDEVFSVQMPSEEERMEVVRIHLSKRGHNPDEIDGLEEVVDKSAGFVPAEIEGAVKDGLVEAFTNDVELTGELIAAQLDNMRPLSIAFAEQFNAMAEWAANNARPANVGEANLPKPARRRTRPVDDAPEGRRAGMDMDG